MLSEGLEFLMLFLFGLSWPFAILRTYRAKRVEGKSPVFEMMVIAGYFCGIFSHLVSGRGLWVIGVYGLDIALVSTDLMLYFHYKRLNSAR